MEIQKFKKTVYLPVKVEDELPEKDGEYTVLSKCNVEYPLETYDTLKFQKGKFQEISNWKHIHWLKPQELFVFDAEQLNQLLSDVIKDALNTAAEKVQTTFIEDACPLTGEEFETKIVDRQSITNTFKETFKKFEV